ICGTERHESRRIDKQLRGRAGRQGDPGSSRFFLSLQDDLLRIFGGERIQGLMLRLGMEEDVPIESKLITKRIAAAQKAVEAQNFAARKHLLEYDDVMNKQRTAVYSMRRNLLEGSDQKDRILEIIEGIIGSFLEIRCADGVHPDQWDLANLETDVLTQFGVRLKQTEMIGLDRLSLEDHVKEAVSRRYQEKEQLVGVDIMRQTERVVMLHVIDNQWKDHLLSMDHLKEGIGLRGYGQKDPLIEYKKESFQIFQDMMDRIEDETIRILFFLQAEDGGASIPFPSDPDADWDQEEPAPVGAAAPAPQSQPDRKQASAAMVDFTRNVQRQKDREMAQMSFSSGETLPQAQVIKGDKVGRNDPCPCGSGQKYKKCHGK
ncbi:MAG: SEC-C domain-containing protein, partial [Bryobacteraceae bacterium]|nr:SEC-C domain-containing protein [Bryobacteraceae bacterium]